MRCILSVLKVGLGGGGVCSSHRLGHPSRQGGHSYFSPHLLSRPGAEAQEWHTDGAHFGKEAAPWDRRDTVSVRPS